MTTHIQNVARLEMATDYIDAAHQANERGDRDAVTRYLFKIDECVRRTISAPSPLANMTPAEAVAVQSQTIRERLDCDHLGKVVAERERQGWR